MAAKNSTKEPRLRARGPIRVTLPASVAYDPDALKKSLGGILDRIGCQACCSGADILLQMEREFIADADSNIRGLDRTANPDPHPWKNAKHQYTVGLSPSVKYDIDRVFVAIDKVIDIIGAHPCISGFDILLRDELRTIVVNEQLDAQRFDAGF